MAFSCFLTAFPLGFDRVGRNMGRIDGHEDYSSYCQFELEFVVACRVGDFVFLGFVHLSCMYLFFLSSFNNRVANFGYFVS